MSNKELSNSPTSLIDAHVSIVGKIVDLLSKQHEKQPNENWLSLNNQKQSELIGSWSSLLKSQSSLSKISFPALIGTLEELPIIHILPDTDNSKMFFDQQKQRCKAKATWLKAIFLDKSINIEDIEQDIDFQDEYNQDLKFTSIKFTSSIHNESPKFSSDLPLEILDRTFLEACLSKIIFDLATATYPNSNDLKTLFPSVETLWICCEFSVNRLCLREKGITGAPVIRSKRQTNDYITESIKNFLDLEIDQQKKVVNQNLTIIDRSEHLFDLLLNESVRLRKEDSSFDDSCYERFFEFCRYFNNITRNDSVYQISYILPNDRVFNTKQNNKIPKDFAAPKWGRKANKEDL